MGMLDSSNYVRLFQLNVLKALDITRSFNYNTEHAIKSSFIQQLKTDSVENRQRLSLVWENKACMHIQIV